MLMVVSYLANFIAVAILKGFRFLKPTKLALRAALVFSRGFSRIFRSSNILFKFINSLFKIFLAKPIHKF